MRKDTKIYFTLGAIVILIIIAILTLKNNSNHDEEVIKCIAEKAKIYSSLTCSACKKQKEIFGEYYNLLDETDCFYETQKCIDAQIPGYPTWIINGQQNPGVKTIEQLKQLTGC